MAEKLTAVGSAKTRIDGLERVTGRAQYTGDVQLPDMLYARVLRSPHPHAKINKIDVSAALQIPGVRAIISRQNCDVVWTRGDPRQPRYLFNNPVRFVGDPVAAVAAVDRHTAEKALGAIRVDYEVLDFVLDQEESLESDIEIYEGGNLAATSDGSLEPEVYRRGDLEQGLAASSQVIEGHYRSKHVNNAQMEPRVSVAKWEGDKLTVWASTQGISNCHRDIVRWLKLRPEQVRVVCQYMGGGFGNKNQCQDLDLMAAVLAREAGQPVKLEFTRKEDFLGMHGRWPTSQYYKAGVNQAGELQAIQLIAYSGMGGYRKSSGQIAGIDLYRCPHVEKKVYPVYTNMAVSANFRAPAYPQGAFGMESVIDDLAHRLEADPVEFRLANITRQFQDRVPYTSNGLEECLRQGAEMFDWKRRWKRPQPSSEPIRRGIGVGIGAFGARLGRSSAVLRLDGEGKLWVHVGVTDVGTGAKTTMALLAAESTGIPLDRVEVVWGDTDRCPYSVGESGSRTTNFTGYAILEAAKKLKQLLKDQGTPSGREILTAEATPEPVLEGKARYSFAVHFAEVEVDVELGGVQVTRYLALHDVGRVVNPLTSASQVQGGVIQGLGMALHEELLYDQNTGIALTPGYYGARVMTHLDAPQVEVHFVETEDDYGPYGAKAVGEIPIVPVVAAVANAIFNATGHRFHELPISRDKIIEAAL